MFIDDLQQRFKVQWGDGELRRYLSPGRVNLIGEHTDYNGGYVFPCALNFGTYAVAKKGANGGKIRVASANPGFENVVCFGTDELTVVREHGWANCCKGVVLEFVNRGFNITGFDLMVHGNIPNGAGLSSSASLGLVVAVVVNDLFDCGLEMLEMVKLCQHAENTFMGVNCGIMDQFAVGMGKENTAIFLNCKDLSYRYVPLDLGTAQIVVANTNLRRGLADSKYNERRSQCEEGLRLLKSKLDISLLGDLSVEEFEEYSYLVEDPLILKRVKHIVYEDNRALEAVKRLEENDINAFGRLMVESHNSLRDLYDVTGMHLDCLMEEAMKIQGVYGSRMTGAGFGGCTVSIVEEDAIESFMREVSAGYNEKTGLTADFYIAKTGDGARRIG